MVFSSTVRDDGKIGAQEGADYDLGGAKGFGSGGKKRALVVGINNYASPNQLPSCVKDAETIAALLKTSFSFDEIAVRTEGQATKAGLVEGLESLFRNTGPADRLVFFFSGHGYRPIINNVVEEALVTQDSQFFGDDELAALMDGLPGGVLTIVLDACFSGGMEKLFLQPSGRVEFGKIKRWISLDPAEVARHLQLSDNVSGFSPFGVLSPASSQIVRTHLAATDSKGFQAQPFEITELRNSDSKGLLLSACLDSEEAAASTSQTAGLSAFTFALTSAINRLGANAVVKDLIAGAGSLLRQIGIGQTPMLKEPSSPPNLGSTSFVLFQSSPTSGAKDVAPDNTGGLSQADIQDLIQKVTLAVLRINTGGDNMSDGSSTQKDWGQVLSTVLPIVMATMQSKSFQPDKDWIDDVGRITNIVTQVAPVIAGIAGKGYQQDGKSFLDNIPGILPAIIAATMQSKGYQPGGKDWIDDINRITQIATTVAPVVASLAGKGYQPSGKNFLGDIGGVLGPIIAATMQSKSYQPDSKDFIGDLGRVASTAGTLIPLIASLQSKGYQPDNKNWLDDVTRIASVVVPIVASMQSKGA